MTEVLFCLLCFCGSVFGAYDQECKAWIGVQRFEIGIGFQVLCSARSHAMINTLIQEPEGLFALAHLSLKASHVVYGFDCAWVVRPVEATLGFEGFT